MTIQELKSQAERGDVNAMMALGDHFYGEHQENDFPRAVEESLPWYEKAARSGSVDGAGLALLIHSARVLLAKEQADWEMTMDRVSAANALCAYLMDDARIRPQVAEDVDKCADICMYATALCNYQYEEFEDAIDGLDMIEESSEYYGIVNVLWGISLSDMDRDADGFEKLMILEGDLTKVLPSTPDAVDEEILERGILYMALYIRMLEGDVNRAHALISRGIDIIKDVNVRQILIDELSRYKKKLFGGYKYVG